MALRTLVIAGLGLAALVCVGPASAEPLAELSTLRKQQGLSAPIPSAALATVAERSGATAVTLPRDEYPGQDATTLISNIQNAELVQILGEDTSHTSFRWPTGWTASQVLDESPNLAVTLLWSGDVEIGVGATPTGETIVSARMRPLDRPPAAGLKRWPATERVDPRRPLVYWSEREDPVRVISSWTWPKKMTLEKQQYAFSFAFIEVSERIPWGATYRVEQGSTRVTERVARNPNLGSPRFEGPRSRQARAAANRMIADGPPFLRSMWRQFGTSMVVYADRNCTSFCESRDPKGEVFPLARKASMVPDSDARRAQFLLIFGQIVYVNALSDRNRSIWDARSGKDLGPDNPCIDWICAEEGSFAAAFVRWATGSQYYPVPKSISPRFFASFVKKHFAPVPPGSPWPQFAT